MIDIVKKINLFEKEVLKVNMINESGIKNIKNLSKYFKTATIYFHIDLDGVTSAIGMKSYLSRYGIKTTEAIPIQYGELEYSIKTPKPGSLAVLVDFASGKPIMKIWTDHHDSQHLGVLSGMSTSFIKSPSNASYISQKISYSDIFPSSDIKIIDMVDSAKFIDYNVTVDEVMRAVFGLNKNIDLKKNKILMGLATNKLILTYKNKPGFLEKLVMTANPSLISIYNITRGLAKKAGYAPPEDIEKHGKTYVEKIKVSDKIKLVGTTMIEYAPAAKMFDPGSYDRYSSFKAFPDVDYRIIHWPMGLIQVSKNPFKKGKNSYHLGEICQKILNKYKGELKNIKISFGEIKETFEKKTTIESIGYTYNDFINMFSKKAEEIEKEKAWSFKEALKNVGKKKWSTLPQPQKDFLNELKVTAWDIIQYSSGGHKDITNISSLNFISKNLTMKILNDLIDEMKDKHLQ